MEEVTIEKLVHGGQGLATLSDGRKAFVWSALPGEIVRLRITKQKHSYVEAIAEEIVKPSKDRVEPEEENYLATSPWQIMTFDAENQAKLETAQELFDRAHVVLPDFTVTHDDRQWQYRNKMEYSFWGDDDGLHMALYRRGSHAKQIVTGSKLATAAIDVAANQIVTQLSAMSARAGDLKTLVVRCNQRGEAVAALFTKLTKFKELSLSPELQGLRVWYSDPKSPASVPSKLLYELGDCQLEDQLLGKTFVYDVDSFFQVNLPIFERTLERIREHCNAKAVVDMYAGVGTIGLSVATKAVDLIELDSASSAMAAINAAASGLEAEVIEASTERALDYVTSDKPVIFDPPRAGLHSKIIDRIVEALPPQIVYLSCNPATQARDLAKLQDNYTTEHFEVFNFFPRTPHIETLAVLKRKT